MLKKDSSAPSRILPLNIPPSRSIPESAELQTKDQLIEKIKEWVKIDNEIRTLQTELNKRKENKKKVSTELMNVMKRNEIDVFDIKDGQIIYDKRNVKKPVTKTALMSILSTYYNGDVVKAAEINQYIMDNREEVVREKIIRKPTVSRTLPSTS
jgi:seryl-tRNA synthetase